MNFLYTVFSETIIVIPVKRHKMVSGDECVDPIEHISFAGLRSISSIADVLPMPDSIDPVDKLDEDAAQGMG